MLNFTERYISYADDSGSKTNYILEVDRLLKGREILLLELGVYY